MEDKIKKYTQNITLLCQSLWQFCANWGHRNERTNIVNWTETSSLLGSTLKIQLVWFAWELTNHHGYDSVRYGWNKGDRGLFDKTYQFSRYCFCIYIHFSPPSMSSVKRKQKKVHQRESFSVKTVNQPTKITCSVKRMHIPIIRVKPIIFDHWDILSRVWWMRNSNPEPCLAVRIKWNNPKKA